MKHDDAEYAFLDFETDLDIRAANTHIGMFLGWAIHAGLAAEAGPGDTARAVALADVRARRMTGGEFLGTECDCKLMSDDLSAEGNAFAAAYYAQQFFADYEAMFKAQMPDTGHANDDFCSVPDTWENFDRLRPVLDRRYAEWKAGGAGPAPTTGAGAPPAAPTPSVTEPVAVEAAPTESISALRARADGDDREAQYLLAIEYLTGERLPQDFALAAGFLEKAAQRGLVEAQYNLGVCYQRGDGKPKSIEQALRWWGMAAQSGHAGALHMLGMCYRTGDGVAKDFVASNALMLMAKARGSRDAQQAGVMAGSFAASAQLAEALSQPGQLIAQLAARRLALKAGTVDDGLALWRDAAGTNGAQSPAEQSAEKAQAGAPSRTRGASTARKSTTQGKVGLHHLALVVGSASFILLLLLAGSLVGTPLKLAAVALAVIGAWGSYATGRELQLPTAMRLLLTGLALIPVFGSFACIAVLLRWVRHRYESH